MALTPLFDRNKNGPVMRVAAFMSGKGTNIIRLLEREKELERLPGGSPFKIIFIFSDRSDGVSEGEKIAFNAGIPYFSYDIRRFHSLKGLKRDRSLEGIEARKEFDSVASRLLKAFDIDIIALGGYMSYITLNRCINVHPGDLSMLTDDGERKYIGDRAVADAIAQGESSLRASTLWIDEGVDTGPLLMVSEPLKVELPAPLPELIRDKTYFNRVVDDHQRRLKEIGDWKIFPLTVEMIADGRFSLDEDNNVYADGKPVPQGYRIGENA